MGPDETVEYDWWKPTWTPPVAPIWVGRKQGKSGVPEWMSTALDAMEREQRERLAGLKARAAEAALEAQLALLEPWADESMVLCSFAVARVRYLDGAYPDVELPMVWSPENTPGYLATVDLPGGRHEVEVTLLGKTNRTYSNPAAGRMKFRIEFLPGGKP